MGIFIDAPPVVWPPPPGYYEYPEDSDIDDADNDIEEREDSEEHGEADPPSPAQHVAQPADVVEFANEGGEGTTRGPAAVTEETTSKEKPLVCLATFYIANYHGSTVTFQGAIATRETTFIVQA